MMRFAWAGAALLAVLATGGRVQADDKPLGAACDDAIARQVWELAIDLCSPELLPESASPADRAHILRGRAKAYAATGDKDRAAADSAEAVKLDPDSADSHIIRARALQARGKHDLALQEVEAAFRDTASVPASYYRLRAAIQRDLKRDDRALPDLDYAIQLDPKSAQAYAMRASIYLARGDNGRAQADIKAATTLSAKCELQTKSNAGTPTYTLTCPEPPGGE